MKKLLIFVCLLWATTIFCQNSSVAIPKVTVVSNVATLSAKSSIGKIGSYYWSVTPSVLFPGGRSDGGSDLSDKIVTLSPNTKYTFTLTVADIYGGVYSASVDYIPPTTPIPIITIPTTKTIKAVIGIYNVDGTLFGNVTVYTDKTVIFSNNQR